MSDDACPELADLREAEEFFEALGVRFEPRVLDAHRLQVMKAFGLAAEPSLAVDAEGGGAERRRALARALREAYATFADGAPRACNPFAPGLVQLRRRRDEVARPAGSPRPGLSSRTPSPPPRRAPGSGRRPSR